MDPRQRLHMMDAAPVDGRRRSDDPVLVAHPRGGRAPGRRASSSSTPGRLAASGDFRVDPAADDRPAAHASRSARPTTGALAAALLADPAVFGAELRRRPARGPDRRLRRLHPDRRRAIAREPPAIRSSRSPRPTTRSRASSATWCADERRSAPLVGVTLRGLLGRRRTLLMRPARRHCRSCSGSSSGSAAGGRDAARDPRHARDPDRPAARRAGLRDGGARLRDRGRDRRLPADQADRRAGRSRWPRGLVAAGLTAALVVPPIVLTGLLLGSGGADPATTTLGFALAAWSAAPPMRSRSWRSSVFTSRALVVGLGYTLIWEGVLSGLLEGTRFLSIRQATLGVAAGPRASDVRATRCVPRRSVSSCSRSCSSVPVLARQLEARPGSRSAAATDRSGARALDRFRRAPLASRDKRPCDEAHDALLDRHAAHDRPRRPSPVTAAFFIGLREGLEAALIVGIIGAYLVKLERRDALRGVWVGVGRRDRPVDRGRASLVVATVGGLPLRPTRRSSRGSAAVIAVVVLTWMLFWMRRQGRAIKGELEHGVDIALAGGSVLGARRPGLRRRRPRRPRDGPVPGRDRDLQRRARRPTLVAALVGLAVAVGLGCGDLRGRRRIDLRRFFTITGVVLIFVVGRARAPSPSTSSARPA